ncbi:unnamed protein product [Leptidea sinapis]|uniref:ubiquitinyl hydrolase 1 n=1 Tax=Leptidea sinapis TaxID=189913 RepID=A0A5E4Q7W3_9NEOP|nr:unnamed protein product [Leptidea sinapis]
MPKVSVKVKWGKELFPGVEVNTEDLPIVFKAQIFALTGVQPERQKVVCKGVTLRDDTWGNFALSNLELPEGLVNLGNTCYMNATVQCLKTVPELRNALLDYDQRGGTAGHLTSALSDTVQALEEGGAGRCAAAAAKLLHALHEAAPHLAERGAGGQLAQQDASECWTEIVRALRVRLTLPEPESKAFIEKYFGGTLDVELVCSEAQEPPTRSTETFLQLSCFISQDKMSEQITKMSETLGRDAVYTKTSKISRLPAYLTVQFVRFYYKEKESINAKILKDVKFPLDLDVYELCTPDLQERLTPMRNKFKAVLTHRGRSSSSGHYVAWVKRDKTWLRCDDDTVSPVTEEEVLKLSGGGDWHCAYLLLYGPRILELPEEDEPMVTEVIEDATGAPPTAQA